MNRLSVAWRDRIDQLTWWLWRERRLQRAARMLITETLANRGRHEHPAEQAIAAAATKFGVETAILATEMLTALAEEARPPA